MSTRVIPLARLAEAVMKRPARCGRTRLVVVDGPGGSGKSTVAARLATALGGVAVIHSDDFASWSQPLDWWERLEREVLQPLCAGRPAIYRRNTWIPGVEGELITVEPQPVVVLEGVSAGRREITDRLAMLIWVETPFDVRLRRGLERDGEGMRQEWLDWSAREDAHYKADRTRDRADLIVHGDPSVDHEPASELVVLASPSKVTGESLSQR